MEIIQTNSAEFRNRITDLYIEAFSTGQSEQYIDLHELELYIDLILKEGYAILGYDENELAGAVLICPLKLDKALPASISESFNPEKCLYIAEMMVSEKMRGQGIGKQLMTTFFETADKNRFSDAFIRVWDENIPAISLYEKAGFKFIAGIQQTKTKADRTTTFVMNKIYLHCKLN